MVRISGNDSCLATVISHPLADVMTLNAGVWAFRSNKLSSLITPSDRRHGYQSKTVRPKSIKLDSKANKGFLNLNFGF